jgi:phosphonoacetaldehyde hydrolase
MGIKACILDWAGTAVDFGCFAPVEAFAAAFEAFGVTPSVEEIRAPMGLAKRAHIEKMLNGDRLSALWLESCGKAHADEDVDRVYAKFEPALLQALGKHCEPLPGVLEAVRELRKLGVAIGSTTGYTRPMMEVVASFAARSGYAPDQVVCPEDVGGKGRPYPYMLWRNLERLGVLSIAEAIKVGDTAADMQEGKNAGCVCVGVIKGSSMLGLGADEYASLCGAEKASRFAIAKRSYISAGADFVISGISGLPDLIRMLGGGGAL